MSIIPISTLEKYREKMNLQFRTIHFQSLLKQSLYMRAAETTLPLDNSRSYIGSDTNPMLLWATMTGGTQSTIDRIFQILISSGATEFLFVAPPGDDKGLRPIHVAKHMQLSTLITWAQSNMQLCDDHYFFRPSRNQSILINALKEWNYLKLEIIQTVIDLTPLDCFDFVDLETNCTAIQYAAQSESIYDSVIEQLLSKLPFLNPNVEACVTPERFGAGNNRTSKSVWLIEAAQSLYEEYKTIHLPSTFNTFSLFGSQNGNIPDLMRIIIEYV